MKIKSTLLLIAVLIGTVVYAQEKRPEKKLVYKFDIKEQIAAPVVRTTTNALNEAEELNADYVLIHMNTYGGLVDAADSIRTKILNFPVPVLVFIDNNAASAGALIAIAADSIYIRPGGSIGAASVVDGQGNLVPEKFQSYMRGHMRSTAESHGKDTIISGKDTTFLWHRDPAIAEAMVDPSTFIEGVIDTGKVITFSADEALLNGYAEGKANSYTEALDMAGITDYELVEYTPTVLDNIIGLLVNPFVHGLLVMIIIGGIYFELQTPGVGFPLGAAILAALLYFAPLYLEGLVENWEILLFIAGIALIAVEIFVLPGFGIAGISGIVLVVLGLSLALIDNIIFETDMNLGMKELLKSILLVASSTVLSLVGSILISKRMYKATRFAGLILDSTQDSEEGFVVNAVELSPLVGKEAVTHTILRPSGKVSVDNDIYDACCEESFIDKGEKVVIIKHEAGQLYVKKI